jgi:hypothetical protein
MSRIQVTGMSHLMHALKELPNRMQRKHLRIAHNAGGGVLKRQIIAQSPSKHLKTSQAVKVSSTRAGNWYTAVGTKRGKTITVKIKGRIVRAKSKGETRVQKKRFNISRIVHLLEKGTRSHPIQAKNKRVLATPIGGIWNVFGRQVRVSA